MDLLLTIADLAIHLDRHLVAFVAAHGAWVYGLLFAIVFAETVLVVRPFLPGDSLLFVVGALCGASVHFRSDVRGTGTRLRSSLERR